MGAYVARTVTVREWLGLKKRAEGLLAAGEDGSYLGMILCLSFFLCGCLAGAAAAGEMAPGGASEALASVGTPGEGGLTGAVYFSKLLSTGKYHIAAVFFGFSVLGVVCVPCLAAARGFFLCFTVSALTRTYGAASAPLTLAMFSGCILVALPCFFVLSVQSFSSSLALYRVAARKAAGGRAGQGIYGRRFTARCALCAIAVAVSALADALLAPRIASLYL
jgi:hypothetical protein